MAELSRLEALVFFHQELIAVRDGRASAAETLDNGPVVQIFETELDRLWSKPPKSQQSRDLVQKGNW